MPDRPHERPTAIRTTRFAVAFGPRRTALPVADRRAARNSIDVRLTTENDTAIRPGPDSQIVLDFTKVTPSQSR
jgi:hypothetical protein